MIIKGKVHKFGNDINTDDIIAAKYLVSTDPEELGKHCMEHVRPDFIKGVAKGDIIVAGKYFGCGSSREHAPLAILGCGISAVIAKSFASIFFRNSINIGLPILECKETDKIEEGDVLEIDLNNGIINNINKKQVYKTAAFPPFLQKIIQAKGLINAVKAGRQI
ncbi:MAG: 3-isopropylmalate dehydratase small subunit [Candidatus Omnitrophica bacterium]|nr:3-isopropylmalate dehydratase small subunit [Candidatus Omnitrophota bacterium]MDD5236975.1 3-isopropylmalate dehydratase small subunit [Candidatus Omnitrophota bacterium]MDD5610487.1 3-isopropylmalate dehydratase small subunit [Candidatus Omnitrophota bacterium]